MASNRTIKNELDALKREIGGLRSDYARLKRRAAATKEDGIESFATIRDSVGAGASFVSDQYNEIGDAVKDYSAKTERAVAAHPLAAVAGAIAVGYLVGRLSWWNDDELA